VVLPVNIKCKSASETKSAYNNLTIKAINKVIYSPAHCNKVKQCLCTVFTMQRLCVSGVSAVARCPSVHLSITLVYCIQMAEDIVKLLSRPSSPIILLF